MYKKNFMRLSIKKLITLKIYPPWNHSSICEIFFSMDNNSDKKKHYKKKMINEKE